MQAIRDVVGSTMTLGIRLNIREEVPGGYDVDGGVELAQYFESTGLIDYVHGVIGSPWGNPSYIQPTYFEPAQWSRSPGELKRALSLPVVHTGRITEPGGGRAHPRRRPRRRRRDGPRPHRRRRPAGQGPGGPDRTRSGRASAATSASAAATSRACRSGARSTRRPATRSTAPGRTSRRPHRRSWSAAARPGWSWPRWPARAVMTSSCGRRRTSSAGSCGTPRARRGTRAMPRYLDWQRRRLRELGVDVQLGRRASR